MARWSVSLRRLVEKIEDSLDTFELAWAKVVSLLAGRR
jgi:hypothetical protein